MLYGAETWSLTASDRQKLAVTERALERRMVGVKRTDHISNELLRKTSKVKDAVNQADQVGRAMDAGRDRMAASRHQKTARPPRNPMAGLAQTRHRQRLDGSGQGPKSLAKLLWPASKDRNTGRLKD
ncbi:UNVERIFIED_CONTAM: hypothetical protein FKN15_056946 [Acipenser sinensis]